MDAVGKYVYVRQIRLVNWISPHIDYTHINHGNPAYVYHAHNNEFAYYIYYNNLHWGRCDPRHRHAVRSIRLPTTASMTSSIWLATATASAPNLILCPGTTVSAPRSVSATSPAITGTGGKIGARMPRPLPQPSRHLLSISEALA